MHAEFSTFHWLSNYTVLFDSTVDLKVSTTNFTDINNPLKDSDIKQVSVLFNTVFFYPNHKKLKYCRWYIYRLNQLNEHKIKTRQFWK